MFESRWVRHPTISGSACETPRIQGVPWTPEAVPQMTDADVEFYRHNGAITIRGLLTAEEVDTLRTAIDWNISNPGPLGATASRNTDPTQTRHSVALDSAGNTNRYSNSFECTTPDLASGLVKLKKYTSETELRGFFDRFLGGPL